jgi:hypothetical protein
VPVWHETTKPWVADGKLVVLGVTQEQHAERCRLFAQWKEFDWPILHDPINVLASSAVPIVLAIDEYGIVRSTRPNSTTFVADFLDRQFQDNAKNHPDSPTPASPPRFDELAADAEGADTAAAWRRFGDALALWGGEARLTSAIAAYTRATQLDSHDGPAWFRQGVCLRRRYESATRAPDDFQAAVRAWGTALDLDPNQYIWRRRIQQFGPRLDKPYPFYDWVTQAEADIRHRGETPIPLPVRPDGAEIAQPTKSFAAAKDNPTNPDPDGKVHRDRGSVSCEAVVVPASIKAGESARVHLTFRLAPTTNDHWNNEADPLRVWINPPDGVQVSQRLISAAKPESATSKESRTVGFDVQIPKSASGTVHMPVFAVYHVCDDVGGQCRFVRLDAKVEITVR